MCGIAGAFLRSGFPADPSLDAMRHRGPDGSGLWRSPDGRCVLAHTRLAILDLSPAGAQPMLDEETGNCLVFNGEIYNHLEIRDRLPGISWNGTSDTETLLVAYRKWGADVLSKLKGMFAFAIYDAADGSLLIARDRLGIKPLYVDVSPDGMRFCSELRPLNHGVFSKEMLAEFLRWGYCPEEQEFLPGLHMFPAGSWAKFIAGEKTDSRSFWPPASFPKPSGNPVAGVRKLVENAIRQHLISDVPVAAFLSGGMDSSIVTAVAAAELGPRLKTFSIGFPDRSLDETEVAAEVAGRFGTDHRRIEVSHDEALGYVKDAVESMDCPSIDAINIYIVSRKVAEQGIKVALSGLGGDELFGGYPAFRDVPVLKIVAHAPKMLRPFLRIAPGFGDWIMDCPRGDAATLARWRRRLFSLEELQNAGLPIEEVQPIPAPALCDDFASISWQELRGYMKSQLLRDADQMSMASSLEVRLPFLDHELVEYALGLPAAEKAGAGTKPLLVSAFREVLPESVFKKNKMGFSLPMDSWMRGPLRDFCESGLQAACEMGDVNVTFVSDLRAKFLLKTLHWSRLWAFVVFGHYVRKAGSKEELG